MNYCQQLYAYQEKSFQLTILMSIHDPSTDIDTLTIDSRFDFIKCVNIKGQGNAMSYIFSVNMITMNSDTFDIQLINYTCWFVITRVYALLVCVNYNHFAR